ncbi:MAG TPA: nucleotidyltransferase domain-containing protein [Bryobacteraceae bacterium]|nr:nucleotidyltransferase domain-containing protein [Bryobacteraceae bacterium]
MRNTGQLLNQLVEKLQHAFGEGLVSVVLYGSAAAGDHHPHFSDYNVLCVLREISRRELAASEPIFRWWREQGSPSPLLLTETEVANSTDCFAIEFHDIKKSHRVLFGKDVVEPLVVDDSFYRAQVEHDLRAKLLRLRQKAAGMLSEPDQLRRLLADSVSTFCVLFRHALVLHAVEPPAKKREVVQAVAALFGADAQPFERLLDIREEQVKPREVDPVSLLDAYLKGIEVVVDAVDRLEK